MRTTTVMIFFLLSLVYESSISAAETYEYETQKVVLTGTLIEKTFYGPPGYGEDPKHDAKEQAYIVKLQRPITVVPGKKDTTNEGHDNVTDVQVVNMKQLPLKTLLKKKVTVVGTLFSAFTGHHHTEVLISANDVAGTGNVEDLTMSCYKQEEGLVVLKQAPSGAKRISKHHLRVNWAGGKRDFIDKPPYDEPLDGVGYSYCGFNAALGMHLIHKADNSIFTGILLNNSSGKIMEAGEYVSFSPDKSKYLAVVQPDGLDGEKWHVYSRSGVRIWQGLSGIIGKTKDRFTARLENPRWNSDGELEATHTCIDDNARKNMVMLRRRENTWEWMPIIQCPEASP